jgi:hypothetical protein
MTPSASVKPRRRSSCSGRPVSDDLHRRHVDPRRAAEPPRARVEARSSRVCVRATPGGARTVPASHRGARRDRQSRRGGIPTAEGSLPRSISRSVGSPACPECRYVRSEPDANETDSTAKLTWVRLSPAHGGAPARLQPVRPQPALAKPRLFFLAAPELVPATLASPPTRRHALTCQRGLSRPARRHRCRRVVVTPSWVVGCARATEVAIGLHRDRSRRVRSW